jgi:hypothetical protein
VLPTSALFGVLARLQDLGLELIEMRRLRDAYPAVRVSGSGQAEIDDVFVSLVSAQLAARHYDRVRGRRGRAQPRRKAE